MKMSVSKYDALTNLYKRQAFFKEAESWMQLLPDKNFHLIVSNIKDFKIVNAVYGKNVGDKILCKIADAYNSSVKDGLIARNGNDQFICLLCRDDDMDQDEIDEIIKTVTDNISFVNIKNKYGVCRNIDKTISLSRLCDCGFLAIKNIADDYSQDVVYFTEKIEESQIRSSMIERDFAEAIDNREFNVYYQPKVNIHTRTIIGAEALVRWIKKDGTVVSPMEFIPVYEKDGLIEILDEYVFREVCRYQKHKMEQGKKLLPISINISRVSVYNGSIAKRYADIVREYGIPFDSVPLELTELAAMEERQVCEAANKLVQEGLSLHMDDFGSGHSSLISLNRIPFSVLKLDKSLIDHVNREKGRAIIEQTIVLAKMLNMDVIAEGVETEEQVETLETMGCSVIQGYYYAKPMPEEEFEIWKSKSLN